MTTLIVDQHRDQMLQCLQQGRGYEFLSLAARYLLAQPGDDYVRMMAAREYVKLGLIRPARELLGVEATGSAPAELAAVSESLASLPDGVVPWSQHRPCYEANLAALRQRGVGTSMIEESWHSEQQRYELYQDRRGVQQVRRRDDEGRWHWVPLLTDHPAIDRNSPLPDTLKKPMPGPYLFDGLGHGGFFERIYKASCKTFLSFSCALYVCDSDPSAIAFVLHLRDWAHLLRDPRVMLFVGPKWKEQILQAWKDDPNLPLPLQIMSTGNRESAGPPVQETIARAQQHRVDKITASLEALQRQYEERDIAFWARRFNEALEAGGAPLRILAAVSRHTTFLKHAMRDAQRAFEQLGHQCIVLTEGNDHEMLSPLVYHRAVQEMDPDVFFCLDHLRPEFENVIPRNLPMLTWDQDQLPDVFTAENVARIAPIDFVTGYARNRCIELGADPRQYLNARVPTCAEQFSGAPLNKEELARFACDVSFVSHASQTPRAFHEEERGRYQDPGAGRFLDLLYEMVPSAIQEEPVLSGLAMNVLIDEAMRRFGAAELPAAFHQRLTGWYLWRLVDRIFRHEALEWVAAWARRTGRRFRIYGNGWDRHPTLSAFAAGPVDNGRDLLCVHRASSINLQFMPAGFIHQRATDGLAAGGFFLTRLNPSEMQGGLMHALADRVRELGLKTTAELLACEDSALRDMLRERLGHRLALVRPERDDLITTIQTWAEILYADQVFPRFGEIAFDSAASFEQRAERFLSDEPARRALALEMRGAVLEHFSYRPTMAHFLRRMADYLREAAAEPRVSGGQAM